MDVEMERQGLPTAFAASHEQATAPHEAANMVASTSNAETGPLKQVVQPESSEPVTSFTSVETLHPDVRSSEVQITENGVVSAPINGDHLPMTDHSHQPHTVDNSSSTQTSQPLESSVSVSMVNESITATSATALEDSLALPTKSVEVASEVNVIPQSISEIHTNPTPMPEHPISDLRSAPQIDIKEDVSPSVLASTTELLSAEPLPESSTLPLPTAQINDAMSQTPSTVPGDPVPASLVGETMTEEKLPSTSIASPSPVPQPAKATSPEDQAMPDAPAPAPYDDLPLPAAPGNLQVEEPRDPAPTPALPVAAPASENQTMTDAYEPSQSKVAREREDDHDDSEPAAKRAKTEVDEEKTIFKVPEVPTATQTPPATNGASPSGEDNTITAPRMAHMKKIISNLKKGNSSQAFRLPVDYVALNIPSYPEIVKEPMDLGTIDTKLKTQVYAGVNEFVRDFNLVVNNCYTFNGRDHAVSQQAQKMETSFNSQMKNLPPTSLTEPSKEEKKLQKVKVEPMRQAPPRRQSMNAGNAKSPSASNNPQTFALGPEGVPLIRRDSTVNDGRAKRAVVPPKRHSDFGGRPKKKKYELELKFCYEVLKELQAAKHWQYAQFFLTPVDPVALNIPTYFQIIKKPMDLSTVQSKLDNNAYEKASEFKDDVQLVFKNCFKFNPEGEHVNECGHKLEEVFNKKWEGKDDWIAARQPDSEPHSAAEEEDDEEEEESEADDESEDDRTNKILQLQKQIEMMSKQMGELTQPKKKKKSTPPAPPKKTKTKGDKREKSAAPKAKKEEQQVKKKTKKVKEEKERFVTYNEKQYISNGISQLPDKQMGEALKLIQQNVPSLKDVNETEIELDIDELPNRVLLKLLQFVEKSGGGPLPPASEAIYAAPAASGGRPKKNKPMGKSEQEAHIAELRNKLSNFQEEGGANMSPNNPVQSVEHDMDTSGDEGSDSEESEEE